MLRKRTTAGLIGVGVLAVAGVAFGPATQSFAHTPEVAPDCHGVTINLTDYQIKPATTHKVVDVPEHTEPVVVAPAAPDEVVIDHPYVPAVAAVPAVPAVYGDRPIVTPAVPAQPGTPAVTHVEYRWHNLVNGKDSWLRAGETPNGKGWIRTADCRTITDKAATPAVPGRDAVYGDAPLITPEIPAQPAVDEIPEVSHIVKHPAVIEDKVIPATYRDEVAPGDDEPNTVSITTSDANHSTHEAHTFGTEYHGSVTFEDSTVANTYTVDVVAFDDPDGTNGWTREFTGTTVPCGPTVPPTESTPVVGTPTVTITPDTCTPTSKIVRWKIPVGLSISGVTGTGQALDLEAEILHDATGGSVHPRSWILPVTVLDGYTYDGPATITLRQDTECATTPPTGEPSTPAPSDGPTTEPTDAPSPTGGTTPPVAVRNATPAPAVTGSVKTPTAAPVAADTSAGTDTLAYTGLDRGTMIGAILGAILAAAFGAVLLILRTRRRRTEIGGGDR